MEKNAIKKLKPGGIINRIIHLDYMTIVRMKIYPGFSASSQITVFLEVTSVPQLLFGAIISYDERLLFFNDCLPSKSFLTSVLVAKRRHNEFLIAVQ